MGWSQGKETHPARGGHLPEHAVSLLNAFTEDFALEPAMDTTKVGHSGQQQQDVHAMEWDVALPTITVENMDTHKMMDPKDFVQGPKGTLPRTSMPPNAPSSVFSP